MEEEDIIDLFNNIFDDPDDIVNNVFEQNDNHHPADNNVDGQDLDMAEERQPLNDNNDGSRVPEGWESNKRKQGDCNMTWLPEFTSDKSFLTDIPNDANELYIFLLFLTENVLQSLVNKTNNYAETFLTKEKDTLPQHSRFKQWKIDSIPLKDMKVFIALTFYFGVLKKLNLKSYWTKSEVYNTPFPSKVIKRDFFLNIFAFQPEIAAKYHTRQHVTENHS